jgi:ribonuclease P protein component
MDRRRRITESWEISRVRSNGVSASSGALVGRVFPNKTNPAHNRYTVIAGKRIGKAHDRNRCKRLTREAMRMLDPKLAQGYDLVVWLRGGVDELKDLTVAQTALREIARKTRILKDAS